MEARNQRSRSSLQFLRLIGVVAPSLLIVTLLIMFVGFGGWALLMDIRSPGHSTNRLLLALVPYLGLAIWLGSAFLRFGVRLLPVASNGTRRPTLITVLVLALSLLSAPYVLFATELAESFGLLSSGIPLRPGGEFDFESLGETFALFALVYGGWLLVSLGAPLSILLYRHLNPTSWRRRPYLLFLRRFSGLSNAIGIGPLVRGVPVRTRVVFLVGPRDNPRIWNPFMMAFSGIRLTRPLSAVPICLQSTEDSWRDDIQVFATDARATVVDLTDESNSMQLERKIAEGAERPESVLWLYDCAAGKTELPGVGSRVGYRTSKWGAVPAAIIIFMLAGYMALGLITLLPIPSLSPEDSVLLRLTYAVVLLGIPIAAGFGFAWRYAWHPRLTRRSNRRIRLAVRRIFEAE